MVAAAYAPDIFEKLSGIWNQELTKHLTSVMQRKQPVLNWMEPESAIRLAESLLQHSTEPGIDHEVRFRELITQMLAAGQNLHHPHYIGHQVPACIPMAALFDAVGTVTNQPMAVYEMGPWASAVERAVVRALCRRIGWNADDSAGLLTSGGSLANLTALLTARNVTFPDSWEQGLPSNAVLITHTDAHYCITRAAGILGLGTGRVRRAPLDHRRRMDPEQLHQLILREKSAGQTVLAVVAAACATPIGAFDPLPEIAEICRKHQVWLHVDAAHGGGALMSRRHRHLLTGIDMADSVVWDAHKMMFVPALCASVLYRNKAHRFRTFQQDAPYLFDPASPGMAEYDNGTWTVECTKHPLGFGLWGVWSMFGETLFEQLVDRTFELAAFLHQLLLDADDFAPLHVPECNIVAFQYRPAFLSTAAVEQQDQLQQQIRTKLIRSGDFYIVQTRIEGRTALRVTVMNPLTTRDDLAALLDAIRTAGDQVKVA